MLEWFFRCFFNKEGEDGSGSGEEPGSGSGTT